MTSPPRTDGSPSVTELVSGIVGDVQDLGMQHLAAFRNEIKQDLRKATNAAATLAIGGAVVLIGGLLLSLMIVHLLSQTVPEISLWVCYGAVGIVIAGLGGILVYLGVNKLQNVDSLSKPTSQIMKDDAKWLMTPK